MDVKLIYFLYRALQLAGSPFIVLYFLLRVFRNRRYLGHFGQRLGFLPHHCKQTASGSIWLHAVSVGEVLSSMELLRRLRAAFPSAPLFVSTTTLAGRALADEKLRTLADGIFYSPFDFCFAVRRVLRTIRPAVVIVAETEIWPNLYREAKRSGSGLLIVNARISDRALPRYLRFRWFFRRVLHWPDKILVQTDVSLRRYLELGAPPQRLGLGGNLKYDFEPRETQVPVAIRQFLEGVRPEQVLIAASTMPPADAEDPDEDGVVIQAFRELARTYSRLLLILVPRRPERFDVVARKLAETGVPFVRRSELGAGKRPIELPGILLLDSIGELSGLFALADVVFMGGTLPKRGGHNILEPAFFARPVVMGPHMENFPEIAAEFLASNACVEVPSAAALGAAVATLLGEAELRAKIGARARELAEAKRGATKKAVSEVEYLYWRFIPRFRPPFPVHQFCWLLSRLWWLGSSLKRWIDTARREWLRTPVISVGGVSMGGAGKTPFVLWLAGRLKQAGHEPAILTRGYRRRAPEKRTVLEAGASAPVARTGDEAQIFLRSGVGPVGICGNRAVTGRLIEERFRPGVFILDDGFQHWRLGRTLDIVVVDGLAPLGGVELCPLGRLREPLDALGRADAFVIARTERDRTYEGIRSELRSRNPRAPIFLSRVVPEFWTEYATDVRWEAAALPFSSVAAFCGLANPGSFWRTLDSLGYRPVSRWVFGDHHHYKPLELRRLAAQARAAGAEALLTTEKDLMNLCAHVDELIAPLKLCWLKIGLDVEREEELLSFIGKRVRTTR